MPEEGPAFRPTDSDGLQVIEDAGRLEKCPARMIDDPKYLTSSDDQGLHVVSKEDPLDCIPKKGVSAPPRTKAPKKLRCVIVVLLCLVITGACVGGVLGSRRRKSASKSSAVS